MKKYFFAWVVLLALLASVQVSAGSGQNVTERRNVNSFERIKLMGSPTIKYRQGNQTSVEVRAPKSIIKNVETRVEGNQLVVSIKNPKWVFNFGSKENQVVVYVTSPDLIGLELLGSGDFECKGHVDSDQLRLLLKGSGDIDFKDVICDKLSVSVIGSGDLNVDKVVAIQSDIELIGSGDIRVGEQQVKQTKVELKGSGDVKLSLVNCGTVDCRLLGSGDITLQGDATKLNSYTRGSGEIHSKGLRTSK